VDFVKEVREILLALQQSMRKEDVAFVENLLMHNKASLALEVLCDQLIDQHTVIPEDLGHRIKNLVTDQNLSPRYTWEFVCVYDRLTGESKRLLLPNCNAKDEKVLSMIIAEVADRVNRSTLDLMREFLEVNEITLCVETLFSCLADDQITLSPHAYKEMVDLARAWNYSEEQIKRLKCDFSEAK
jgi:hypothetical protein